MQITLELANLANPHVDLKYRPPGPNQEINQPESQSCRLPVFGRPQMDKFGKVLSVIVPNCVKRSKLYDGEAGDQSEVPHVDGQHGVANLERRCSDQSIPERDDDPSALLLPVDLACQQRCLFSVGVDFQVV